MKLGYTLFYVDDVEKTMMFYSKAFGLESGFSYDKMDLNKKLQHLKLVLLPMMYSLLLKKL